MIINRRARSVKRSMVCLLTALLMLAGCMQEGNIGSFPSDGGGTERLPHLRIDQEQATFIMEADDGHIVVDVRRQDEYEESRRPCRDC